MRSFDPSYPLYKKNLLYSIKGVDNWRWLPCTQKAGGLGVGSGSSLLKQGSEEVDYS
jgi:hypothetical protein